MGPFRGHAEGAGLIAAGTQSGSQSPREPDVRLWSLFWVFFQVGLFTIGGGLAMATVIRHELVLRRRWVTDAEFMQEMSLATLVPGAIAVNIAHIQGRRLRGGPGSVVAVLGTVLPSFFTILFIALFALPYFEHPVVAAFLRGCAVAVAGQLAFTAFVFARTHLRGAANVAVCLITLVVLAVFGVHPVVAMALAGALGYLLSDDRFKPTGLDTAPD